MNIELLIALLYQAVAIVAVIHVVMDNRQPAKTMAWALVIYFVPVVGIVLYLFFGQNTRKERLVSQRSLDQLSKRSMLGFVEQPNLQLPEQHMPLIDLFVNENFSLPFKADRVELFANGYQFFPALLREIARARNHIHIDMYIFADDALGRLISDALIAKAREGVEVRVVYDDVGCWSVDRRFFERMREEGIEVMPFLPVRFPSFTSKVNYRNHRKLIVIDGAVGFIGGMNIALRYVKGARVKESGKRVKERRVKRPRVHVKNQSTTTLPWRDTMVMVTGVAVYSLQRAFLIDWYFVDRTLLSDRKYYPQEPGTRTIGQENTSAIATTATDTAPQHPAPQALIQTVTAGPASPYPQIMQGYVRLILAARKYIYIETPYFLPTEPVFFALKTAAASGVNVRLLVPRRSDTWFAEWGGRSFLREAHKAGISVNFYTAGFLHSKLMVCDDSVATCGSTNVDFRSFENNFEANIFFYDSDVAQRMKQLFLKDEARSLAYTKSPTHLHPGFFTRLFESLVRLLSPLI